MKLALVETQRTIFFGLAHIEMYADVLSAFDWMPSLHRRKESPFTERFEQDLIEARIGGWLDEFDIDRAVNVNGETSDRDGLIRLVT